MVNQARSSAAVQLGNTPMMMFGGELSKYVQFVTMFRNTYTIKDSSALYDLILRHVIGQAKNLLKRVYLATHLLMDMKKQVDSGI